MTQVRKLMSLSWTCPSQALQTGALPHEEGILSEFGAEVPNPAFGKLAPSRISEDESVPSILPDAGSCQ